MNAEGRDTRPTARLTLGIMFGATETVTESVTSSTPFTSTPQFNHQYGIRSLAGMWITRVDRPFRDVSSKPPPTRNREPLSTYSPPTISSGSAKRCTPSVRTGQGDFQKGMTFFQRRHDSVL